MAKYVCSICGFTYDEAVGIPEEGLHRVPHGRTCRKTGLVLFAEPKKVTLKNRERLLLLKKRNKYLLLSRQQT